MRSKQANKPNGILDLEKWSHVETRRDTRRSGGLNKH